MKGSCEYGNEHTVSRRNCWLPKNDWVKQVDAAVTVCTCIVEVLGSHLGRSIAYPDCGLLLFLSVLQADIEIEPEIRPRPHPCMSFPVVPLSYNSTLYTRSVRQKGGGLFCTELALWSVLSVRKISGEGGSRPEYAILTGSPAWRFWVASSV
jgi:hypothetical protein